MATSAIAAVEVARAIRVADAGDDIETALDEVLDGCAVVGVDTAVVRLAGALAAPGLRTLDAVHLSSALVAGADVMFVYDRQLARAAGAAGLRVEAPGSAA